MHGICSRDVKQFREPKQSKKKDCFWRKVYAGIEEAAKVALLAALPQIRNTQKAQWINIFWKVEAAAR